MRPISIHALRGEGDAFLKMVKDEFDGISIHALRGEGDMSFGAFASRPAISIHALRGEGDSR